MASARFSLRRLFGTITLLVMGVGTVAATFGGYCPNDRYAALLFWPLSGGLLGAGILNPFRRPLVGFAVGFAALLVLGTFLYLTVSC